MFDSHVHFDAAAFAADLPACVQRAWEAGVRGALNPALNLESSRTLRQLHRRYRWIYPCVGLHPLFLAPHPTPPEAELRALLRCPEYAAVGEVGLDFWHGRDDEERQRAFLACQAQLAQEFQLPLALHIRKAFYETFAVLKQAGFSGSGVVHAFSGNRDMARLALDRGFYLSVAATVGYPHKQGLQDVLRWVPRERLLVETDAPDLPPWNRRGRLHQPWELPLTVDLLAQVLGSTPHQVAQSTAENARRLFAKETTNG